MTAALVGPAAWADETGSNASDKAAAPTATSTAVERAHLASELAGYGRATNSPMAMVMAAELTAATAGPDAARQKTSEGGSEAGGDKSAKPAVTVASLLDEARAGPSRTHERVRAGATDSYTIRFRGGEPAAVLVSGDGDTDLDLYVYDQNGNRICSDTDNTDTMLCRWTPSWTGAFTIKIKNYGRVYNDYIIRTN